MKKESKELKECHMARLGERHFLNQPITVERKKPKQHTVLFLLLIVGLFLTQAVSLRKDIILSKRILPNSHRSGSIEKEVYEFPSDRNKFATINSGTTRSCPQERNPRQQAGQWMGNIWIPPEGWALHSSKDLGKFYRDQTLTFLGDSTARRTGLTLHRILHNVNRTLYSPSELNARSVIDQGRTEEIPDLELEDCRKWNLSESDFYIPKCRKITNIPQDSGKLILYNILCYSQIADFFEMHLNGTFQNSFLGDVIVVSIGAHHAVENPFVCEQGELMKVSIARAVGAASKFQKKFRKKIVFRSTGYPAHPGHAHPLVKMTVDMNQEVRKRIQQMQPIQVPDCLRSDRIAFLDFASAIEPVSFGRDRIAGDNKHHHGTEPRIVLIQMLTNLLLEHEWLYA